MQPSGKKEEKPTPKFNSENLSFQKELLQTKDKEFVNLE